MIHEVRVYSELHKWAQAFVKGSFGLFFLIGQPGKAKTYGIRELIEEQREKDHESAIRKAAAALQRKPKHKGKTVESPKPTAVLPVDRLPPGHHPEPLWIKGGAVSAFQFYKKLWYHKNELVIFDDVDAVTGDRTMTRLLMALCETEEIKSVGWHTSSRQLDNEGIDHKFETRSRVCIIANALDTLSTFTRPLVSRGAVVRFSPSPREVLSYIKKEKFIKDETVVRFVERYIWMVKDLDIRNLINAVEAKKAKLPWETALANSLGIRDMLIVEKLDADKTNYHTEEQRVAEFMSQTGLSRPMFFKAKKELHALKDAKAGKTGGVVEHLV